MTRVLDEPAVERPELPDDWPNDPGALYMPLWAHTLDGFRAWVTSERFPEKVKVSFLGDKVYFRMSPERFGTHNQLKAELGYVLYGIARAERLGLLMPDGMLVTNQEAELSSEPDLTFVRHTTVASGAARFVPTADGTDTREVVGAPDFVCEIVSPDSVTKDARDLRERYHAAGAPEYWLIDARGRDIRFELLTHTADGYVAADPRDGWRASPVFAREFRLTREMSPAGVWQYTLDTRPLGAGG